MEKQSMGLPEEFGAAVFARKFRWLAEASNCPAFKPFVNKFKVDHVAKIIDVSVYDVATKEQNFSTLKWILSIEDGTLKDQHFNFTTLDGCGNPLYTFKFEDLRVVNHTFDTDYADSDAITQNVKFSFLKKTLTVHPFSSMTISPVLALAKKPKGKAESVEETKIDFLNGTCFLPGPSKKELNIMTSMEKDLKELIKLLKASR
jgi:hypothetical protein